MGEKIATRCDCLGLKITEEDDEIIVIDDDGKREVDQYFALVGKLITKRQIKMGLVGEAMQNIWRPVGGMTTEEMLDNTMIFRFSCPFERKRILDGGPWHFDKYLFVLKEVDGETPLNDINLRECEFWVQLWNVPYVYMTKITAENLGKGLGRITKIDVDSEGNVKGNFIRIKVGIDVDKPLKRVINAIIGGKKVTLNLKYEKLENFCYACGKIDHVLSECENALPYGPWLRAQNHKEEVTKGNVDDERDVALHVRERLKREQDEKQRLKREQDEKEILKREQDKKEGLKREQDEKERLKREQDEKERLKMEQDETERLKMEQDEKERLKREQDEERLKREQDEKERLKREQDEKQRLKREQDEKERLKREQGEKQRLKREQDEKQKLKREQDEKEGLKREQDEKQRLKREQDEIERKTKENAETHLYTIVKVARDEDLLQQIGRDIYFDLVDHDKVRKFRVQNQMPFIHFKDEVAKEFGAPAKFQRFWLWAMRENHSYRPNRPLTHVEENQSVGQLRDMVHNTELEMFLEIELGLDSLPVTPPPRKRHDILLFFKLYDPWKEELSYVGRLFVRALDKPIKILIKLNELAGYAPDEQIDLYEEIKFEPNVMCEPIDMKFSFRRSELEDGDIVCFQKSLPAESRLQLHFPDLPSFLEHLHNHQEPQEDDSSSLEL